MSRRGFLRWSALVGSAAASSKGLAAGGFRRRDPRHALVEQAPSEERMIRTGCPAHNCGGRCLLKVFVRDGRIVRIETDDRPGDTIADPQLRACVRGRAYRKRQYHPDRLQFPMKRTGKRGEGKFERIGWDEALDRIAAEFERVKAAYGNQAFYVPYGTGSYNQINGRQTAQRLMNLYGGSLGFYNSYSWAAISAATPTVYGTSVTGNQRQDWLNAKYILMWSWNPAEMRDGTNSEWFVQKAREKGARVVCVDPRMTLSAVSLADEWIPIRPGTDAAMMTAMAYVMVRESLIDAAFVRTHCVGFDETQMPAGAEGAESYKDYLLGARDGVPKTPEWAEGICGVPRETIARIAREYATTKPGVLYQGYGMQRRAYGEQAVRAGCVLAAITGNVGVPGGWASGIALQAPDGGPFWLVFPTGDNPVQAMIPSFLWTEAVLRGKDMGEADGVRGAAKLDDRHQVHLGRRLQRPRQPARQRQPDGPHPRRREKGRVPPRPGQLPDPDRAVRRHPASGLHAVRDLGARGRLEVRRRGPPHAQDRRAALRDEERLPHRLRDRGPARPREGVHRGPDRARLGGLVARPLPPDALPRPALARRAGEVERGRLLAPGDAAGRGLRRFPARSGEAPAADALRARSRSSPRRSTTWTVRPRSRPSPSTSRNGRARSGRRRRGSRSRPSATTICPASIRPSRAWTGSRRPSPSACSSIPSTPAPRKIKNGDTVKVWNDRGAVVVKCRLTPRIMPGVVALPQGAWWTPDKNGLDRRGSVNVLSSERWTPLAFGNAQHTIMVQVEKAEAA